MDDAPIGQVCRMLSKVVEKSTLQEANDGEYMLSYPSSFIISALERLCVQVFKDQAGAELTVDVFDSGKGGWPHLFDK